MKPEREWDSTDIAQHFAKLRREDAAANAAIYLARPDAEAAERHLRRAQSLLLGALAAALVVAAWVVLAPPPAEAVEWPCVVGETCGRAM